MAVKTLFYSRIPLIFFLLQLAGQPILSEVSKNNKRYVFVVDASGSMAEKIDGVTRMAIAKDQLMLFLNKLPKDSEVGFVAYGNRIAGCNSARLYQPIKKGGASSTITKLTSIIPSGSTPIAQTLALVGEYLLVDHRETEIIFISDGIESCEGDPIATLSSLKARGKKFNLHILGINLDPKGEEDLTKLAFLGNGRYFPINKREDMEIALLALGSDSIQESLPFENSSIHIQSILPYSQSSLCDSYIIHYEFKVIPELRDQMVQLSVFPRLKTHQTKEPPSLRERRFGDISQTEIKFHTSGMDKGKIILCLKNPEESEISAELWNLSGIPKIIAKSEIKLLQQFTP